MKAEAAYAAVRTLNEPRLVAERLGLVARMGEPSDVAASDRDTRLLEVVT